MFEGNEVRALAKALYIIIKKQGLFKEGVIKKNYDGQIERMGHQLNILSRKRDILQNHLQEYVKWNSEHTLKPPMTENECLVEFTTLYCNFGLVHYEALKRFFLHTLHIDMLDIHPTSTYGAIAQSFKKLSGFDPRMSEMLDNNFRNALAHDTWHIRNSWFMYHIRDDKLVKIPISDIPTKIHAIGAVYVEITEKYTKDFTPGVIQDYEAMGRSEVNKRFPLYGMDED